jgi:prolyl oligopeptidase
VETKAGHGAGKPVSKLIEEDADIFTFLFKYLDVREP